jgi:hypothetical protein
MEFYSGPAKVEKAEPITAHVRFVIMNCSCRYEESLLAQIRPSVL